MIATETLQVMCVQRRHHSNPCERIVAIGGVRHDGSRWHLTELQAITAIKTGAAHFFVPAAGRTTRIVVDHQKAREYLKTQDDGEAPEGLLDLPDCPG